MGGRGERQRLCGGQVEETGVSGGDGGGGRGKWRRQGAGESRVREGEGGKQESRVSGGGRGQGRAGSVEGTGTGESRVRGGGRGKRESRGEWSKQRAGG